MSPNAFQKKLNKNDWTMNKLRLVSLLVSFSITLTGCLEVGTQLASWNDLQENEEPNGRYEFLEDSGVKVYIPLEFEKISISEYQQIVREKYPEESQSFEIERMNQLKDADGELYLFFDKVSLASITVNTFPFTPLTKQDAQYVLGINRLEIEKNVENSPIEVERISSKYNGSKNDYIFKYVYKFTNTENDFDVYTTAYFITKNFQTVFINLNAGFNAHYDPFALKTIM
ncbi:hypothetical protein C8D94_102230 [Marinirhabdus gelatinilytica]|uniref:Uncharacterized protein n=2 Tax=Marinirhabdus gelatinilytica TaxID=1703343 RepID=A0A370QFA9_9FLAO|nr:hypothetical protein C8D94_102230 [Marinirhabdus gelatinilytica]